MENIRQKLILAASPAQEAECAAQPDSELAHMAYAVSPELRLMRLSGNPPGRGGLLYFALEQPPSGAAEPFLNQLRRECAAQRYRGVIADLPPRGYGQFAQALDRALAAQRLAVYLPEPYAQTAPRARILVSTAISGGTLKDRLESAVRRYGADRTVAALERRAEDFPIPARTGCGTPLTPEALNSLRRSIRASVYYSPELCARYFTYLQGQHPHFVLFDDSETMRAKRKAAQEAGIAECLAAWTELVPQK